MLRMSARHRALVIRFSGNILRIDAERMCTSRGPAVAPEMPLEFEGTLIMPVVSPNFLSVKSLLQEDGRSSPFLTSVHA